MARQGDILIEAVKKIPKRAIQLPDNECIILAEGEVTGHRHEICSPHAMSFLVGDRLHFKLLEASTVRHPEHRPILLPAGTYRMIRQRESSGYKLWEPVYVND